MVSHEKSNIFFTILLKDQVERKKIFGKDKQINFWKQNPILWISVISRLKKHLSEHTTLSETTEKTNDNIDLEVRVHASFIQNQNQHQFQRFTEKAPKLGEAYASAYKYTHFANKSTDKMLLK